MKNPYIINLSKKFWFWFWQKLMDGFAPTDEYGNYKRPKGFDKNQNINIKINKISEGLLLIIGNSCPWSHRALIVHKILNLSEEVEIIYLKSDLNRGQWLFKSNFEGCKTLNQLYKKCARSYFFRATVPLLITNKDNKTKFISNESSEIIELLSNRENDSIYKLFKIHKCSSNLFNLINNDINNGVYKCGFARNQSSYERASKNLFNALNVIEKNLKENNGVWICGKNLTFADVCLFPTLIRWELVYRNLFKCSAREISDFKQITKWRLRFFELPGIAETCLEEEWIKDYYSALFPLNPNQIIPICPPLKEILIKK